MALSTAVLGNILSRLGDGQNKQTLVHGTSAFVTTGTSVEVTVPLKVIRLFIAIPYGTAAAANGQLSSDETYPKRSTTAQDVTVTRAAGTTSGMTFFWIALGEE